MLDLADVAARHSNPLNAIPALLLQLRQAFDCEVIHLELYDPSADLMKNRVYERDEVFPHFHALPLDRCPGGWVWKNQRTWVVQNLDRSTQLPPHLEELRESGVPSYCFLPLTTVRQKLGALGFGTTHGFEEGDVRLPFLRRVAAVFATILEGALDRNAPLEGIAEPKSIVRDMRAEPLAQDAPLDQVFTEIVGTSNALREVLAQVKIVANSTATVLVLGETGTGKELVARAIHRLSSRAEQPFVSVNCTAIPTDLLESELFGHEKGAYTGATGRQVGRLELAHRGTLLLDEVGDLPIVLQPKLLRVLQEKEFERLGSSQTQKVDVRLIAVTNQDLHRRVTDGEFRADLFYRLNVFPIYVPPLRERRSDIPALVRYFVAKFAKEMKKSIQTIPGEAMNNLINWSWPGNVRELQNFLERCVLLTNTSVLSVPHLGRGIPRRGELSRTTSGVTEREHILYILRETGGVIAGAFGAAARLGMKRSTLYSRMKRLNIGPSQSFG
jgi:formate hydrogenlyase transcriptional activator